MTETNDAFNESLLQDRIEETQATIEKYGGGNFCLSFSGGKDSTVVHELLDMALPGNTIPRVFCNTGIEYNKIVEFVQKKAEEDSRFHIIKPSVPIQTVLREYGYPFKSKEYSHVLDIYQRHGWTKTVRSYCNEVDEIYGLRYKCPDKLKYQFTDDFGIRVSDKCCNFLKERPFINWQKENRKPYAILGIMRSEGGRRITAHCHAFRGGKFWHFQPLAAVDKQFEDWFIERYGIELCELYKPPYNFDRTGCKGCPFNVHIQRELNTLEKYFPEERKQCELIWKPVYEEYRRIGYRLKN